MRIGIDITPAVNQPNTGIGRYTQGLVEHIACLQPADEYCLVHASNGKARNPFHEKLARRNISARRIAYSKRQARALWLLSHKLRFGVDLTLGKLDLFHATDTCGPRLNKIGLVTTIHDLAFFRFPDTASPLNRHYLTSTIQASLKRSARVIAVSNSTKRDLINLFNIPEEKIRVVYLGVDEGFSSVATPDSLEEVRNGYRLNSPFILFVGAMEPRKNLVNLITAYNSLIRESVINHSLVIAGARDRSSKPVFKLVRELGMNGKVIFTGEVAQEDLVALYSAADLFVLPSLYEGFGFPPLEAMACGTPTIVSDVSSLPEIVGNAALKVAPEKPEELARSIRAVLENHVLRHELVTKGLQQAKKFSWRKTAEETLNVYKEVEDLIRRGECMSA